MHDRRVSARRKLVAHRHARGAIVGRDRLALRLPEAVEASHMEHPDFRVNGKIFATLGYPTSRHGVVMITPAEQERLMRA